MSEHTVINFVYVCNYTPDREGGLNVWPLFVCMWEYLDICELFKSGLRAATGYLTPKSTYKISDVWLHSFGVWLVIFCTSFPACTSIIDRSISSRKKKKEAKCWRNGRSSALCVTFTWLRVFSVWNMLVLLRESSGRLMPLKTGAKSVCNDGLFWHEASQLPTAKRSALKYVAVKAIASISPEVTIKRPIYQIN